MTILGFVEIRTLPGRAPLLFRFACLVWRCAVLWGFNLLIAVDQLGNALVGGDPQETISSRAGKRAKQNRGWCLLCKGLDLLDERHCDTSRNTNEGADSIPARWKAEVQSW